LKFQHILRLGSDKIADHISRSGVMAAIHEFGRFHAFVAHQEMLESLLVYCADRFLEISVYFWVFKFYIFWLKISQNPWEDGVLWKIAERSITSLV
jgi:hypothetical protein